MLISKKVNCCGMSVSVSVAFAAASTSIHAVINVSPEQLSCIHTYTSDKDTAGHFEQSNMTILLHVNQR